MPSTARKLPSLSPSTCILIFAQSYTTPVSSDKTRLILSHRNLLQHSEKKGCALTTTKILKIIGRAILMGDKKRMHSSDVQVMFKLLCLRCWSSVPMSIVPIEDKRHMGGELLAIQLTVFPQQQ